MTTKEQQIERFQNLIRVLDEVAQNQAMVNSFSLSDWFALYEELDMVEDALREEYERKFDTDAPDLLTIPHKCGTTACAVGYAGLDPWFRTQGLRTSIQGDMHYHPSGFNHPLQNFPAVYEFFGIEPQVAGEMFTPYSYVRAGIKPTLANVRARVQEHLDLLESQ